MDFSSFLFFLNKYYMNLMRNAEESEESARETQVIQRVNIS